MRSLKNKIEYLNAISNTYKYDIIIINETWLSADIPDKIILKNYKIYRNDRNSHGGGVMIGIDKAIKSCQISRNENFEDLFVEVVIDGKFYLFSTLYRSPKEKIDFKNYINQRILNIKIEKYKCFILFGDLNMNFNSDSRKVKTVKNLFMNIGLKQIVSFNTYPQFYPNSCLDLCFISNEGILSSNKPVENLNDNCDHLALETILKFSFVSQKFISRMVYSYNENNLTKLNNCLFNTD